MKIIKLTAAILSIFAIYVFFAGTVDNSLTDLDLTAIQQLPVKENCAGKAGFSKEIKCISSVQKSIRDAVKDFRCAAKGAPIDPHFFLERGFGCCFDRARYTEKALAYYGFETRHVSLYDKSAFGYLGIFIPGIASHATSEVKTSRGWMGVDSNEPFILLSKQDHVFTYANFKGQEESLTTKPSPEMFYKNELIAIYGLYSRHGMFHGRNLPSPEINWRQFKYNFFSD